MCLNILIQLKKYYYYYLQHPRKRWVIFLRVNNYLFYSIIYFYIFSTFRCYLFIIINLFLFFPYYPERILVLLLVVNNNLFSIVKIYGLVLFSEIEKKKKKTRCEIPRGPGSTSESLLYQLTTISDYGSPCISVMQYQNDTLNAVSLSSVQQ